jgi:hypothetical protein
MNRPMIDPKARNRWRFLLLAEQANELFAAAARADFWRLSVWNPRSEASLTMLERDPWVSAIWSLDRARESDIAYCLADAAIYLERAENELIAYRRRKRWEQSPEGKRVERLINEAIKARATSRSGASAFAGSLRGQ